MRTNHRTTVANHSTAAREGVCTHSTLLILALGLALGGCASVNNKTAETLPGGRTSTEDNTADAGKAVTPPYTGGGYYKNDGPGANPPDNLAAIPDAVPKQEELHRYANNTYKVFGRRYVPIADKSEYKSRGLASWYGRKFHGKATATGEVYDMYAMSAAHATLPLPSYARVTNLENGKSVVVRVNDRGPFHPGRIIDLSYTAAYKLDILKGVTPVEVESVLPDSAPTSFAEQSVNEPVVPVTPVAVAEPKPGNPGAAIYLQLGAFGNQASAENLLARVSTRLSKDFPGVSRQEFNGLHKIQAGPFASADAADHAAHSIQRDLGIKSFKVLALAPTAPAAPPVVQIAPVVQAEPVQVAPVAPVAPVETSKAPSGGLYLQLAAVSSPEAASALADRVKNHFGDELPGLDQVNVGTLFKVQAGPFATPEAAANIALACQQNFGIKPYRVTR